MSRAKFYAVTIVMCVIAAFQITISDNKAQIDYQIHWLVATIAAYALWCDWDWLPKSWWRKHEEEQ